LHTVLGRLTRTNPKSAEASEKNADSHVGRRTRAVGDFAFRPSRGFY
jgi:hypothetical protein